MNIIACREVIIDFHGKLFLKSVKINFSVSEVMLKKKKNCSVI